MPRSPTCPHAFDCARLYLALEIMGAAARNAQDPVTKAMHRSFLLKAGLYGYDVPPARHRFRSAVRRETVRAMIDEAADILLIMQRRARPRGRSADEGCDSALRFERVA